MLPKKSRKATAPRLNNTATGQLSTNKLRYTSTQMLPGKDKEFNHSLASNRKQLVRCFQQAKSEEEKSSIKQQLTQIQESLEIENTCLTLRSTNYVRTRNQEEPREHPGDPPDLRREQE